MKPLMLSGAALLVLAGTAEAKIPLLNASCAQGVEVHADEGGPVYVNGKEGKLKKFNNNYYEVSHGKVTISISINPDGTPDVSATWRGGGNGICTVAADAIGGGCPADVSEADRYKYPACN